MDTASWEDSGGVQVGFWRIPGVPRGSLGAPRVVPGGAQGSRHPSSTATPKKCPKSVTVIRNRVRAIPAGRPRYQILGHPGSPYFTPLEPYSVPRLRKKRDGSKMGFDLHNKCSIGVPRETGFRAEIPKIWRETLGFSFSGFSRFLDFPAFLVFP